MKPILLVAIALLLGLTTCDHCENLDCLPPFDVFKFSYISANNEDLLGGATKKYSVEDLKFYGLTIDQTKIFSDIQIINSTIIDLSHAEVYLRSDIERLFLEVNGVTTDTIDFSFSHLNSKCCGTIATIQSIKLNGLDYSGNLPMLIPEKN